MNKRDLVMSSLSSAFRAMCVALVAFWLFAAPAAAQDVQALLDRIERLERDIRTLNIQVSRGDAPISADGTQPGTLVSGDMGGASAARMDERMTALESDVRTATGAMEEIAYRVTEISSQLEKLVSDIDFRLSSLEQGGATGGMQQPMSAMPQINGVAPSGEVSRVMGQSESGVLGSITENELQQITSTAQTLGTDDQDTSTQASVSQTTEQLAAPVASETQSAAVQPAVPVLSPQEQYTHAFGLLRQAKYEDAAVALQAFIDNNAGDKLVANARYWLGESYYVRSEFVSAAGVFFEGYRSEPTGPKAPDTLLKLGMSLGNLGKQTEACAAFSKLADEFPQAPANVRSTMERERMRNGC